MKIRGGAFVLAAFFAAVHAAQAESIVEEVRGGIAVQACCGPGGHKEQGVGISSEVVFRSPEALSFLGAPRPLAGVVVATDSDATSFVYGGFEWRLDLHPRFFVAAGAGGAVHNGETDDFDPVADADRATNTNFYGCRAHFRINSDAGYRINQRWDAMVSWSHISNAGLCNENEGLDHLGLRLGYKF